MKNKQKILSLVLAAAMLLSFVTVTHASTTNLALNKNVQVSSAHGSHPAGNAVDGKTLSPNTGKTRWQVGKQDGWLLIDLGGATKFNKIKIEIMDAVIGEYHIKAADTATVSDGKVTLTGEITLAGGTNLGSSWQKFNFDEITKQYVYFYGKAKNTSDRFAIWEFEVYDIACKTFSLSGEYDDVIIPGIGGEDKVLPAPAVTVTDEQDDTYAARNGDVVWSLGGSPAGVSINSATGAVTVTNGAAAGTVTVRVSLADDDSIYQEKTIELIEAGGVNDPTELLYTNGYGVVTVPAEGSDAVTFQNDIYALNNNGEMIDPENYTLTYVFNNGVAVDGISVDAVTGAVTLNDSATDGIYEVVAVSTENSAVKVTIPLDIRLDIKTAKDTANLALNCTVTETSHNASNTSDRAVDGKTNTRWESIKADNEPTLTFDLGNSRYFNRISLLTGTSAIGREIILEAADDAAFTVNKRTLARKVVEVTDREEFTFPTTRARYLRLRVPNGYASYFQLFEFCVYRTKAVGVSTDAYDLELVIPVEGSFTCTNTVAYPVDISGAALHTDDFAVNYTAENLPAGITLNEGTGALTLNAGADSGTVTIKAFLADDPSVYEEYDIYIQNDIAENKSLYNNFALSHISLVDADGWDMESISNATALGIEIMGVNPGKSDKITVIILVYDNANKSGAPKIYLRPLEIKEFELELYQISLTDIEDLADGCVDMMLWSDTRSLIPIIERLSY